MSTIDSLTPRLATQTLRRGREAVGEQRWVRPALFALLLATAIAYVWNLGASGDANSFYAAAVQAGTRSWKAFFFGSLDSSSFITTDKPPASIWVMFPRRSRASPRSASSTRRSSAGSAQPRASPRARCSRSRRSPR